MILFGVQLGWLPISGLRSLNWEYLSFWQQQWDFFSHLALPIVVATFGGLAGFSRYMRQSMLEVVRQDYVRTARAKGLSERVVISKHALRNALLPVVTILALALPGLIGGSVIIESIFAIPGMGQLMVQSVFSRDYPVVMGILVIVSTLTLVANLVADITYGLVDPRIRFGGRRGAGGLRDRGAGRSGCSGARSPQPARGGPGAGDPGVWFPLLAPGTRTGPTPEDPDRLAHRSALIPRARRALAVLYGSQAAGRLRLGRPG
jgi:hypothetical protein